MERLKTWNIGYSQFVHEIYVRLDLKYPNQLVDVLPDMLVNIVSGISYTSLQLHKITMIINEFRAEAFEDSFACHNLLFSCRPDTRSQPI